MRLPVYNNSSTITAEPRARAVDTSGIARETARGFEIYNQWQKIQDAADAIDGKNALRDMYTAIDKEAEDYTGYESEKDIQKKQQELKTRMAKVLPEVVSKFGNSVFGKKFAEDFKLAEQEQMVKLDSIFRRKTMDNFMAAADKSMIANRNSFIATGDEKYRAAYMADIKRGLDAGLVSKAEYVRQEQLTQSWNEPYLLNQAEKDPDGFIQNIEEYNKKYKNVDAVKVALKAAHRQKAWNDFETARAQANNYGKLTAELYSMSAADAITNIDNAEASGAISEDMAKSLRSMYNTGKADGKTDKDVFLELWRQVNDLDLVKVESLDGQEIKVNTIAALQKKIDAAKASGSLAESDRVQLQKELAGKEKDLLEGLQVEDRGRKAFASEFTYRDAWEAIAGRLGNTNAMADVWRDYVRLVAASEAEVYDPQKLKTALYGLIAQKTGQTFEELLPKPINLNNVLKTINKYNPITAPVATLKEMFEEE